jgi:hypothetical protein
VHPQDTGHPAVAAGSLGSSCASPPTSSSWLNQAGRWFALLTGKQLGHGVLKNVQVLERDSRS